MAATRIAKSVLRVSMQDTLCRIAGEGRIRVARDPFGGWRMALTDVRCTGEANAYRRLYIFPPM